ncbi:ovostatin-like [Bufo bufo]|uniref:ovostatin-like n=1 Tax=Bufo bufo TaxID=8384 RepID=UPI001ABE4408|nr:ovostatin-like [Bufo bufo]
MQEKRLLLSIFLLGLIPRVMSQSDLNDNTKLNYVMSVLPVMKSGNTGQVCLFLKSEELIRFNITFEYQSSTTSIFSEESSNLNECRNFQVPTVDTQQLAYMTFSAVGDMVKKMERKSFVIDIMKKACHTQIEKTMYQPGETVRCRAFCIDSDLKPTEENFTRVYMMEPTGARVAQVTQPPSDVGLVSVEFNLSKDASPGSYRLEFVREFDSAVNAYFPVQRYVLPRYYSTVSCPNAVSVLEKSAEIKVSAQYVYGRPVPGKVNGKCCRKVRYAYGRDANCLRGLEDICTEFTAEIDSTTGTHTEILNLDAFRLQFSEYANSIECGVTMKEAGTGVLVTKSCYISVTSRAANLQLDYTYNYQYYKRGIKYPIAGILTDQRGQPMANELIIIEVNGNKVKNATTDAQGRVESEIDTTSFFQPNISIRISYPNENQCYSTNQQLYDGFYPGYPYRSYLDYPSAEKVVYRFYSDTDSYLQFKKIPGRLSCNKIHDIEVEYKVTEDGVGKGATEATFQYLVKARQEIVSHGQQKVDLTNSLTGSFKIPLLITSDYAINAQMLVIGKMKTEIISDLQTFNVESCYDNEVSLAFTESVVTPGSDVHLELSAAPGSICGLKAYDASLDLLSSYDSLNPDNIYYSLNYYQYGLQVGNFNLEGPAPPCEDPNKEVFCHGRYYRPFSTHTDGDTYSNLLSFGLIVASDLRVRKPVVCGMENVYYTATVFSSEASLPPGSGDVVETVRSNFNDVAGWQTVMIGSDGRGTAEFPIPDTISEWKSKMICLSREEGVGLTNEAANVTTFLPFFVEFTLPQFCTRGEKIIADATVANYLNKCIKVEIIIEGSGFTPNSISDDGEICICKGERTSKKWSLDFNSTGDIKITVSASTTHISNSCDGANDESETPLRDTVIKTLTVEAEGMKREVTYSFLSILEGSTIENEVTLQIPPNLVEDSYELFCTVVGDPVGLVAENLVNLLNLPDGCCEQSLGSLIAVAHMLKYFISTGDIDDELYEKAKSYLAVQYARQLGCRRFDGYYSVFRSSIVLNSWLNINTFWAFELIKSIIYVDTDIQKQTLLLMSKEQNLETGCFHPTGPFFTIQDQDIKNTYTHFTAYMVMRLIVDEPYSNGEPLLQGGLKCLQAADLSSLDTYTLAYLYHAAARANLPMVNELHNLVLQRAVAEGGTVHWQRENSPPGRTLYSKCLSANVDITANMMLGMIKGPKENQDLNLLGQAATWLSQCQNSRGGYSSSLDTASGVEAMTEFGRLVNVKGTDFEVIVSQGDKEVARINVNTENKMVVHRVNLLVVFEMIKISATGTGNSLTQITSKFNTRISNEDSSFTLNVTTRAETCTEGVAPVIYTDICAMYTGSKNQTNMVLVDIKELTGYTTDRGLAYMMLSPITTGEVEFRDNHVQFYLMSLKAQFEVCFTITSFLDQRALLYQNSAVTICDYYDADNAAFAVYTYPCSPTAVE